MLWPIPSGAAKAESLMPLGGGGSRAVRPISGPWMTSPPASWAGGARFQFQDQRLDRATIFRNVGIELRALCQGRADTCNSDVGDTGALAIVAHFPLELDRLAAGVAEQAVDDPYAVGLRDDLGDGQGEPGELAEPLAVGAHLPDFECRKEARPLLLAGLVPVGPQRQTPHIGPIEIIPQTLAQSGFVSGADLAPDDVDDLGGHDVRAGLALQAGKLDAPVLRLADAVGRRDEKVRFDRGRQSRSRRPARRSRSERS